MTVKELIENLNKFNEDTTVQLVDLDGLNAYDITRVEHMDSFESDGTKIVGILE